MSAVVIVVVDADIKNGFGKGTANSILTQIRGRVRAAPYLSTFTTFWLTR